jgi:hypothetical protein
MSERKAKSEKRKVKSNTQVVFQRFAVIFCSKVWNFINSPIIFRFSLFAFRFYIIFIARTKKVSTKGNASQNHSSATAKRMIIATKEIKKSNQSLVVEVFVTSSIFQCFVMRGEGKKKLRKLTPSHPHFHTQT